jgi:hypothetical protein
MDTVQTIQWGQYLNTLLYLIVCAFLLERALAVIFETQFYIDTFANWQDAKPSVAIVFAIIFAAVLDVNLYSLLDVGKSSEYDWSNERDWFVLLFSGLFLAGGSKPSIKLFKDLWNIQSSAERNRKNAAVTIPKVPADAATKAANGDKAARKLLDDMLDNVLT